MTGQILYRPNEPMHRCQPPPPDSEPIGTLWACACSRRYRRVRIDDERGDTWQRCQRIRVWVDTYPHWAWLAFCVLLLAGAVLLTLVVGIPT